MAQGRVPCRKEVRMLLNVSQRMTPSSPFLGDTFLFRTEKTMAPIITPIRVERKMTMARDAWKFQKIKVTATGDAF